MKKIIIILIFLSLTTSILKADFKQDLSRNFLKSLGSAAATAAGLPVNEVTTVANALYNKDFKTAFATLTQYATDSALDAIPVYGQIKFLSDLAISFGNVIFTYIGNEATKIAWKRFLQLDDKDRNDWLNGEYEATIDEIVGIKKVDKNQLRNMFRSAWEEYKKKKQKQKLYLEYMAKIAKVLKMAEDKVTPDSYSPRNGAKVHLDTPIEIWKSKNNYFKLTLTLPDGQSSVLFLKDSNPEKSKIISFKLSDFKNINWNSVFNNPDYQDGVPVTIKVDAAVYDYTGLMKSLMPDMVTPKQNLVKKGYNIIEHTSWNFVVIQDAITCKGTLSGNMTYTVSSNLEGESTMSETIDPTSIIFTCNKNGKAQINIDGEVLSGKCENGVGYFTVPLGYGNLTLHIKSYCNPTKLTFYSTGLLQKIYPEAITNEDGSTMDYIVKLYNIKGSLH